MLFKPGQDGLKLLPAATGALLLVLIIVLLITAGSKTGDEAASANLAAEELYDCFNLDPAMAYYNYFGKIIVVEGRVTGITDRVISLGSGLRAVRLEFGKRDFRNLPSLNKGDTLVVRGICEGIRYTEVIITRPEIVAGFRD